MTVGAVPTQGKRAWTAEEFMALSREGHRYEIVDGKPIDMGSAGALHGYVCSLLLAALTPYVLSNKLGIVLDSSTAFKMKSGNWRSPDISFFAKERLQGMAELPTGFLEGAPDLAVEVLSPAIRLKKFMTSWWSTLKMAAAWFGWFTPASTTSWCIAALKSLTAS